MKGIFQCLVLVFCLGGVLGSGCVKRRGWYSMSAVSRVQQAEVVVYGKVLGSVEMEASGFFRTDMYLQVYCVLKYRSNNQATSKNKCIENIKTANAANAGKVTKVLIEMVKPVLECSKIEPDTQLANGREVVLFLKCLDNGHFKIHEVNEGETSLFSGTNSTLNFVRGVCGADNGFLVSKRAATPNFQCPVPVPEYECVSGTTTTSAIMATNVAAILIAMIWQRFY